MNPSREEALFALAAEKPAEERAAFLARECAETPRCGNRWKSSCTSLRAIAHGRGQQKKFERNALSVGISMVG